MFAHQRLVVGVATVLVFIMTAQTAVTAWSRVTPEAGNESPTGSTFPPAAVQPQVDEPITMISDGSLYFARVNLDDTRIQVKVMLANNGQGGYERVSSYASRLSSQGYADWILVNGDYFGPGGPSTVNCAQGLTYIEGVHRPNWTDYGVTWRVRGNIGFDSGMNPRMAIGDTQTSRYMVIAGGPRTVIGGAAPVCSATYDTSTGKTVFSTGEQFDGDVRGWCTDTRAITMVGYSADGRYLYMGVSAGGTNLIALSQWLKNQGAHEVLKLDSGGSSAMYRSGTAILPGEDRLIPNVLAIVMSPGTPPPPPNCENPTVPGVYFYGATNYGAPCYYSTEDISHFDNTPIGNNDLESVRIVGDWRTRIYEDSDFEGANEGITSDVPDIGAKFPSLDGRITSATVSPVSSTSSCIPDTREGVYFYSDPSYDGNCMYQTEDVPHFEGTAVGNNNLESVRIVGLWKTRIYEDGYFEGANEGITSNVADIGAKFPSLDGRISSATVTQLPPPLPPANCPTDGRDGVYFYSEASYSGTCWYSTADVPDFGDSAVGNNTLASVKIIGPHQTTLYADTYYGGTFALIESSTTSIATSVPSLAGTVSSARVFRTPDIVVVQALSLTPAVPLAGETVTADFSIRNATSQTLSLARLGVGGRGPGATSWDDEPVVDFPWLENVTLLPGESRTFTAARAFSYEGAYFEQITYQTSEGVWVHIGERLDFAVNPGLQVVQGLTLTPSTPYAGQTVTARYTVKNMGARTLSLASLTTTARGPDCADLTCPRDVGFSGTDPVVLHPGEEYPYEDQRAFADAGTGYFAQPHFEDVNGWWLPISHGDSVPFTVSRGIEVITPLAFSVAEPMVGETVTATFTIRNEAPVTISMSRLIAAYRGPDCLDWGCERGWDFGQVENLTLTPGQSYSYAKSIPFTLQGDGYFTQVAFETTLGGPWSHIGDTVNFSVGPGLTILEPLTISPALPKTDQPATASFTVRNNGPRPLSLTGLGVVGRKDSCSSWECDPHLDFPASAQVEIAPGDTQTYSASRSFVDPGGYFAEPAFIDPHYWWLPVPGSSRLMFDVTSLTCPVYPAQTAGSVDERRAAGAGSACVTLEFQDSGTFSISSGWVYTSPLTLDGLEIPTQMQTGELAPQILPLTRDILASSDNHRQLRFVATDLASGSELGFSYTFTTDEPPPPCGSGIVPTYLYADAYGLASTLDGNPIPAGSCILAYDPDGVLCGAAVVSVHGQWGVMHIYGDDPDTPVDEGASSGDSIRFTVAGKPAQTSIPVVWYDRHRFLVELSATSQEHRDIPLLQGWNLFSFNLQPMQDGTPLSVPQDVLSSIAGYYSAVLGYDQGAQSYYPDLPDYMNDLDALSHEYGYWIRMTQARTLSLAGSPVPTDQPLSLDAGWNLVSYLPESDIAVADALTSLGSNLQAVLAFHDGAARSYYPDLPAYMNDLQCLRPDHGYWVKVTSADTLIYPETGTCSVAAAGTIGSQTAATLSITPTRLWCEVYSLDSQCGGTDLPQGTVVRAYDPDGVLCGELAVQVAGEWGTMHVYGDDPDTPEDEGAESGDLLSFTINGQPAVSTAPVTWEDRALRQVSLSADSCGFRLFLPMVIR